MKLGFESLAEARPLVRHFCISFSASLLRTKRTVKAQTAFKSFQRNVNVGDEVCGRSCLGIIHIDFKKGCAIADLS